MDELRIVTQDIVDDYGDFGDDDDGMDLRENDMDIDTVDPVENNYAKKV